MPGQPELCKVWEVNQRRGSSSMVALMVAAQGGHEAALELLLRHPELDVNLSDDAGYTALHFASSRGHLGWSGGCWSTPPSQVSMPATVSTGPR